MPDDDDDNDDDNNNNNKSISFLFIYVLIQRHNTQLHKSDGHTNAIHMKSLKIIFYVILTVHLR